MAARRSARLVRAGATPARRKAPTRRPPGGGRRRQWPGRGRRRSRSRARGGPVTGGLLAVHAHPDDETISTGALLATWASAGLPVTVVTCTRGEQGEVIPPALRHLEGAGE